MQRSHRKANRNPSVDPDLLRRLSEFQVRVRQRPVSRAPAVVVPARGPLSGAHASILGRLRSLSSRLADSLEQSLTDLNDGTRLTYVGPVGEAREVLRASIQLLAPDEELRKQPWFVGTSHGKKMSPTQAERMRYAVQIRGADFERASEVSDMIDERVGRFGRMVYQRASAAFHAENQRREVRVLVGYVFALLDDVLPEAPTGARSI
jgi:hypothetical protein